MCKQMVEMAVLAHFTQSSYTLDRDRLYTPRPRASARAVGRYLSASADISTLQSSENEHIEFAGPRRR